MNSYSNIRHVIGPERTDQSLALFEIVSHPINISDVKSQGGCCSVHPARARNSDCVITNKFVPLGPIWTYVAIFLSKAGACAFP